MEKYTARLKKMEIYDKSRSPCQLAKPTFLTHSFCECTFILEINYPFLHNACPTQSKEKGSSEKQFGSQHIKSKLVN